MGHVDGSIDDLLELAHGSTADHWGPFHELGHNFQYRPWVMAPETTETTCNLWSVYLYEKIGIAVGHPQVSPSSLTAKINSYLATGPDFTQWSTWTALVTYLQLKDGFGWSFFAELFTRYRTLGLSPSNDEERYNEWVRQSSIVANRDLGPFYTAWGFPTSQAVLDEVAELPAWTENPMQDYVRRRRTLEGGPAQAGAESRHVVDYHGGTMPHDNEGVPTAFDDLEALAPGRHQAAKE